MGSVIDKIQELAPTMGTFTTRQMASRAYGEISNHAVSTTGAKLRSLERQGYIRRAGVIYERGMMLQTWRAIQ